MDAHDPWLFVERVTVRKVGRGFIGEARFHAMFECGDLCDNPSDALMSAAQALDAVKRPMMRRAAPEPFGDLL